MFRPLRSTLLLVAPFLIANPASAQHSHDHSDSSAHHSTIGVNVGVVTDWRSVAMAKHMAYSTARPLTQADSVRAANVINELRQAIAKYQDVKVAEADGYKMFAPQLKNQPQYHFTKGWNAISP